VKLQAKRPPGRADRKAGAYASEILRMRAEGYTYEAIREALASVGITLTEASLRREVRRPQKQAPRTTAESPVRLELGSQLPPSMNHRTSAPCPANTDGNRGRQVAEAFFTANPSNPLFRSEEPS
jgi:hypothetical protein